MNLLKPKIIELLEKGNCTPSVSNIASTLKEPLTTIHYNLKKLEEENKIKTYKAVFNYKSIDQGHCTFIFITLSEKDYATPEKIAIEIAKDNHVESLDISSSNNELIIKLRTKDVDEYYQTIRDWTKKYNFKKVESLTSLKQIKSEFMIFGN